MSKTGVSSLRFDKAFGAVAVDTIFFGGHANATFEYIFRMTRDERGFVESVVYYVPEIENEEGLLDRVARVNVKKGSRRQYFYILLVARASALQEWRVAGRSIFLEGAIVPPDYMTEMLWYE